MTESATLAPTIEPEHVPALITPDAVLANDASNITGFVLARLLAPREWPDQFLVGGNLARRWRDYSDASLFIVAMVRFTEDRMKLGIEMRQAANYTPPAWHPQMQGPPAKWVVRIDGVPHIASFSRFQESHAGVEAVGIVRNEDVRVTVSTFVPYGSPVGFGHLQVERLRFGTARIVTLSVEVADFGVDIEGSSDVEVEVGCAPSINFLVFPKSPINELTKNAIRTARMERAPFNLLLEFWPKPELLGVPVVRALVEPIYPGDVIPEKNANTAGGDGEAGVTCTAVLWGDARRSPEHIDNLISIAEREWLTRSMHWPEGDGWVRTPGADGIDPHPRLTMHEQAPWSRDLGDEDLGMDIPQYGTPIVTRLGRTAWDAEHRQVAPQVFAAAFSGRFDLLRACEAQRETALHERFVKAGWVQQPRAMGRHVIALDLLCKVVGYTPAVDDHFAKIIAMVKRDRPASDARHPHCPTRTHTVARGKIFTGYEVSLQAYGEYLIYRRTGSVEAVTQAFLDARNATACYRIAESGRPEQGYEILVAQDGLHWIGLIQSGVPAKDAWTAAGNNISHWGLIGPRTLIACALILAKVAPQVLTPEDSLWLGHAQNVLAAAERFPDGSANALHQGLLRTELSHDVVPVRPPA